MISPSFFCGKLESMGVGFYTGVPDSLLKSLCAYLTDNIDPKNNIIAVNEGCAVGLAAGYHIATGKIPVVYMQNSGLGNAVNPLLSLVDPDVYKIPMIMIVGWRGEPGVHDEPQHVKQGKITCDLLETMGIPFSVISDDEGECTKQLDDCRRYIEDNNSPYALVIRKGTFDEYKLSPRKEADYELTRERAIELIVKNTDPDSIFVSTTGMASRELYEIRDRNKDGHDRDFLTVGCMGHASQIALGIALSRPERKIVCIDGDGAALMHMGGMATVATQAPKNYTHIIINNGVHDSVGGQPTVSRLIDLPNIAASVGYNDVFSVSDEEELISSLSVKEGPVFIEVMVHRGNRSDLGRPKSTPQENKTALMKNIGSIQ